MSASEDQVKAVWLLNIQKYVTWPEKTFASSNSAVVICVVGQHTFRGDLERIAEIKSLSSRPVVIKDASPEADHIEPWPVVFVSASEKRRVGEILAKVQKGHVLTVGESDNFIPAGGIMNLSVRDKRVRLQVSLRAAEAAGLKISSKLLQVADLVESKGK